MKNTIFVCILILMFLFSFQVFAHSGKTDSNGGHNDNVNGGYHYHHGHPAHDHPNGECPYIEANKDNQTNANQKIGFWGALLISAFAGWFGGALLFAILFWPLKLILKDYFEDHLFNFQLICSVITAILLFIYIRLSN